MKFITEKKLHSPFELSEVWKCDVKVIYEYTIKGMPTVVKNKIIYYDLDICQEWHSGN